MDLKALNLIKLIKVILSCNINPEKGCKLKLMGDALQWVSDHLKQTVNSKAKSKKFKKILTIGK